MKYLRKTSYDIRQDYGRNLLKDRGILTEQNVDTFFTPRFEHVCNWNLLDNITKAARMIFKHIGLKSKVLLVVDCDVDGFTSSSLMYRWLAENFPELVIEYWIHSEKQHGFDDDLMEYLTQSGQIFDLIIMPDAGTNDVKQQEILAAMGYDIVIADHHEWEGKSCESENVIIVNNQMSEYYPNKEASGVGVAWQLLRCISKTLHSGSDLMEYLDIVALGEVSDMMQGTTPENRFIFEYGLSHIQNEFFQTFVRKQCFSLFGISADKWSDSYFTNGKLTQVGVAFYITPYINALIRVGTQEAKTLMFQAMCGIPSYITHKDNRTDAEQCFYDCSAAKRLQDKLKNEAVEQLSIQITNNCLENNKILILNGDELDVPNTLTGLCAMGIAAKYKKPTLLGRTNDGYIKGSFRGREDSELKDLKAFLSSSALIDYALGHANAGGWSLRTKFINALTNYANDKLADVDFGEGFYDVDFVFGAQEDAKISDCVYDLENYKKIWGQGCKQPILAINNLTIDGSDISVIGKNADTLKFTCGKVTYIKFKAKDLCEKLSGRTGKISLNIVGKTNVNEFMGKTTPQVIIDDLEELNPLSQEEQDLRDDFKTSYADLYSF